MTEKQWRAQDDAYVLKRMQEIEADPERKRMAIDFMKSEIAQAQKDLDASLESLYPTMTKGES